MATGICLFRQICRTDKSADIGDGRGTAAKRGRCKAKKRYRATRRPLPPAQARALPRTAHRIITLSRTYV